MMRRKRGFSLIELMIVLAIIAILAAIAVPWYGRYAYRARRVDGQNLLLHVAQAEERYYTDNNNYTDSLSLLGYTSTPVTSENKAYQVNVATALSSQAYTVTATPIGDQAKDVCGPLRINNVGTKSPGPASAVSNSNGLCW